MQLPSLLLFFVGYNVVVCGLYAIDKAQARRGSRRIRERTLLWLAAGFGAPGALLAVWLLPHKSRKPRFTLGISGMLLAQILFWGWGRGRGWW